jgi:uracil-DNA glycosylase family 4
MGGPNISSMAYSYIHWWSLAGVDALVGESPAGWLDARPVNKALNDNAPPNSQAAPAPKATPVALPEILQKKSAPTEKATNEPVVFPSTWPEFQQWLASDDHVPGTHWDGNRVLPVGQVGAKLMVIAAWPEPECQQTGALYCGDMGLLLDRMLRAIGLTRDDCYLATMAITRPAGGRCSARDLPELERLMRHHIQLAQPQHILLLGPDITRIMTQHSLTAARGKTLEVCINDGNIATVAVPHPAILLNRPAQKAAAWDSLKLFSDRI